jgi:hypothetical protein
MAGNFNISVQQQQNLPPTVGDNAVSADYGVNKIITAAMLTTDTTPPYSDPEGDNPYQLRVNTLPSIGKLQLNGVDVTVNQIINFTDIENNLFVYVPDNSVTNSYNINFEFDISDDGSFQFSN